MPYKNKGQKAWMKVCREFCGPLTNAGVVGAVVQLTRNKRESSGACNKWGKLGHLKWQCPERNSTGNAESSQHPRMPGVCPKCKKGKHWVNECRSVKYINRQPLNPNHQTMVVPAQKTASGVPVHRTTNIWGNGGFPQQEPGKMA